MSNADIARYSKRLVRYFWDPEPKHDINTTNPIWCLGCRYELNDRTLPGTEEVTGASINHQPEDIVLEKGLAEPQSPRADSRSSSFEQIESVNEPSTLNNTRESSWPEDFLNDFEARIWLTYRANFPAIPRFDGLQNGIDRSLSTRIRSKMAGQNGFTSDTGWGCMIRSGQSLLANTLALQRLGRARRRTSRQLEEKAIIALFVDDARAPFSIHNFVEHGASACGTCPGQWFGPSATAKCIQALSEQNSYVGLKVYVTGDGPDIYEDALMKVAKSESGRFCPTLVLVGTRLGIDRVTPAYWDALKMSLQMPQSVGIAGGRPSSSHYFVGTQGDAFFYLDPHHTRPALLFRSEAEEYTAADIDSCHTRRLRRLDVREMDPSMLIGFLFEREEDWQSWRKTVSEAPGKAIFHVADSEPSRFDCSAQRDSALNEVETFDDDTDERYEGD